jgi:DsbC/DsbD-like thiol-disulfide interchange protein
MANKGNFTVVTLEALVEFLACKNICLDHPLLA